jgi:hypothetical protein
VKAVLLGSWEARVVPAPCVEPPKAPVAPFVFLHDMALLELGKQRPTGENRQSK